MRNPIYLFYEQIKTNPEGCAGQPGDKHYKCYHGNHKIITITQARKCRLSAKPCFFSILEMKITLIGVGLIGHLKKHFPGI